MRGLIVILAVFALALSAPNSARANAVACQADATSKDLTFSFTALAGDGTGQYFFLWSFGDGSMSSEQNPTHTYSIGVYNAVLTVTDAGSQETCSDTVRVIAGINVEIQTCRSFADVRWGQAPLTVSFSTVPSFSCGPAPHTWTWRFGDGQTSSSPSVQHEYSEPGTYWAAATQTTPNGSCNCFATQRITVLKGGTVGVGPPASDGGLRLAAARPNPFGLMTTIAYDLPRAGHTRLTIQDVQGRTVAELVNDHRPAGPGLSMWHGRAATGAIAPPGLYFARLEHAGVMRSTRLVRIR